MLSLHSRIFAHLAVSSQNGHRRGSNNSPPRMFGASGSGGDKVEGMDHDKSDILAAEPKRKGGLMRAGGDVRANSQGLIGDELINFNRLIRSRCHKVPDLHSWDWISLLQIKEQQRPPSLAVEVTPTSGSRWRSRKMRMALRRLEAFSRVSLPFLMLVIVKHDSSPCHTNTQRSCTSPTRRDAKSRYRPFGRSEAKTGRVSSEQEYAIKFRGRRRFSSAEW